VIDIHSHLLPGIDDGPRSWESALRLCRALVADGITTAVATPHVIDHVYPNTTARVSALVVELGERLAEAGVPLAVLPGGEVEMSCRHLTDAPFDDVPTLAGGRYVLIEVPATLVPRPFEALLFSLQARGTVPVVAHPERCLPLQREPGIARGWRAAGALLQVDAESVLGLFGPGVQRAATALVSQGLVHVMASDSHSCERRPPRLAAAAGAVEALGGRELARFLVEEGPRRVVGDHPAGEPPPATVPPQARRLARWLGWPVSRRLRAR